MKNKQPVLLLLLFILYTQNATSQTNVDPFPPLILEIREDGVYHLSGRALQNAGWNLTNLTKNHLRLFLHDKEIPLWISNENTPLSLTDTLLFYGKQNIGALDFLLYTSRERANPFVSVFKEANYYYLTHSAQEKGKRIPKISSKTHASPTSDIAIQKDTFTFSESYSTNASIGLVPILQQSTWEEGEGWSGLPRSTDTTNQGVFQLTKIPLPTDTIQVCIRLAGRSRVWHQLRVELANYSQEVHLPPFGWKDIYVKFPAHALTQQYIPWKITPLQKQPLDWFSFTFVQIQYPYSLPKHYPTFSNETIHLPANNSYLFSLEPTTNLWDISDTDSPILIDYQLVNTSIPFKSKDENSSTLFHTARYLLPASIRKAETLDTPKSGTNFVFITSKHLQEKVREYAAYRATAQGGGYIPFVVTTEQIRDVFGYGEITPWMIQKALQAFGSQLAKNTHVFLVGRGMSFPGKIATSQQENLVSTYGYPASDLLLTTNFNQLNESMPAYPIGRLPCMEEEEITVYLKKVQEYEQQNQPYLLQKKVLHLSGGRGITEREQLKRLLQNVAEKTKGGSLSPIFWTKSKSTNEEIEKVTIQKELQEGVGMVTFLGHGASTYLDFDIGFASNPSNQIENKGKYPLLFFNGCGVGNIFNRRETLTTDWLLAEDKGAIAVLAHSFWSFLGPTEIYLQTLYDVIFNQETDIDLTIGQIQLDVYKKLQQRAKTDAYLRANIQQIILQGDPALVLFRKTQPDLSVNEQTVYLQSTKLSKPIAENDSVFVIIPIQNRGKYNPEITYPVEITSRGKHEEKYVQNFPLFAYQDTLVLPISTQNKPYQLHIEINPEKSIREFTQENNKATIQLPDFQIYSNSTTYPEAFYYDVTPPLLYFSTTDKMLQPIDTLHTKSFLYLELIDNEPLNIAKATEHLHLFYRTCPTCETHLLPFDKVQQTSSRSISFRYSLQTFSSDTYEFWAQGKDLKGNLSNFLQNSFYLKENSEPFFRVSPNPFSTYLQTRWELKTDDSKGLLTIVNMQGKVMFSQEVNLTKREHIIHTKNWQSGTYIIYLKWKNKENEWQRKELVIQCIP
ncbi:MAG: C25 family cysteine peptidase [Spirosomataceae bacterium]